MTNRTKTYSHYGLWRESNPSVMRTDVITGTLQYSKRFRILVPVILCRSNPSIYNFCGPHVHHRREQNNVRDNNNGLYGIERNFRDTTCVVDMAVSDMMYTREKCQKAYKKDYGQALFR